LTDQTHTVVFQPAGVRIQVREGAALRAAALSAGVPIGSLCGERTRCGKCQVRVHSGHYSKLGITSSPDHLSPQNEAEKNYWAHPRNRSAEGSGGAVCRLSCQVRVHGDLVVEIPVRSRLTSQVVRKDAREIPFTLRPKLRKVVVELPPASLDDPSSRWERLVPALRQAEPLTRGPIHLPVDFDALSIDLYGLRDLQRHPPEDEQIYTLTLWSGKEIIRVEPGVHESLLGLAVDMGTTTLAAYLCDLQTGELLAVESSMNPQVVYGEDIMSRISYAAENPQGLEVLHASLVQGVDHLAVNAAAAAGVEVSDILELVVVGNSTMHHFLLGLDPLSLGRAPYTPALTNDLNLRARDLGLVSLSPGAYVHLLPLAAAFIGSDCVGVLLAEAPHRQEENWLIIDVGTNAELVLGNSRGLLCASTPTGPAFEGAHIENGMRASPGAVERVEIDDRTLLPRVKLIGGEDWQDTFPEIGPVGLCGSGLIDAAAELYRTGLISSDGLFTSADHPHLHRSDGRVEFVLCEGEGSFRRVAVTQEDIRQLQLAKAPLYAAAHFLLQAAGLDRPDRIYLAGGFGANIDPLKALLIGMVPDCQVERIHTVGNAAGDGARLALLDREKRAEAVQLASRMVRIELPVQPGFQDQFMLALNFPHMTHPYPSLDGIAPPRTPHPFARHFSPPEPASCPDSSSYE
jgi:uncharacterized 2Fe-2S/4Fe-4S cluster protein (DUF4445 family)